MTHVFQDNSLDIDIVRSALEADYTVLEELGRGGMAMVYRAQEKALEREVAIKVLPAIMAMDKDFVDRFQHEARTAGKLEHPNIVPIYRVGSSGRVIFFVMKLLRGQSLATVLKDRKKFNVGEVRRILTETASALGYAAKRSVVHRDIKPDNILLDDEGRCVLTDFGIAKTSGGPLTAAGTSMGTPRYMSPEHARGLPLDGRSDMYSLGVVAYQCLSGTTPFDADDPFAILYKHINEPLPRPELGTDEERALYAIIEKMLAKKPDDRFQTADDLIAALGGQIATPTLVTGTITVPSAHAGTAPTEIIPTPQFGTRVRRMVMTDRRIWASAAGALVLVIALLNIGDDVPATPAPPVAMPRAVAGDTSRARADTGRPATGTSTGAVAGATTGATTGSNAIAPPPVTKIAASRSAASRNTRGAASKCPANTRVGAYSALMDPIAQQKQGAKVAVNYDACGFAQNTPFNATVRLRKLDGMRNKGPWIFDTLLVASGPRMRSRKVVDLGSRGPGKYQIEVIVRDPKRQDWVSRAREFQVVER